MKILQREKTVANESYCMTCDEFRQTGNLAHGLAEIHALQNPGHEVVSERHQTIRVVQPESVDA